ncbi:MAG: hypothetical protein JWR50_2334 [Mucilaginibacter sp.]|nr:hypothetical protein [Mucilaginibacter sp.]
MSYRMLAYRIKSDFLKYEYDDEDILHNIPELEIIPPHQSRDFKFNLIKKGNTNKIKGPLTIGFSLVIQGKKFTLENPFDYGINNHDRADLKKRTHWLWSNIVKL